MGRTTPSETFRERVRSLRIRRGLSITDLAKKVPMPREELSRIENGHSKNPSLERVAILAKALGVKVTSLLV